MIVRCCFLNSRYRVPRRSGKVSGKPKTAVMEVLFLPSPDCLLLSSIPFFDFSVARSESWDSLLDFISLSTFFLSFTVSRHSSSYLTEASELAPESANEVDKGLSEEVVDTANGSLSLWFEDRMEPGLTDSLPLLIGTP